MEKLSSSWGPPWKLGSGSSRERLLCFSAWPTARSGSLQREPLCGMSPGAWVLSAAPRFLFVLLLGVSPRSFAGSAAALPTRCHRLGLARQGLFPRVLEKPDGTGGRGCWLPDLVRSWWWPGRGSHGTTGLLFALKPAAGGSRVVREGGRQRPRRGRLCPCSCYPSVSCFVLETDTQPNSVPSTLS